MILLLFAIPSAKIAHGINPIAKKKGLELAELKYDLTFWAGGGKMRNIAMNRPQTSDHLHLDLSIW